MSDAPTPTPDSSLVFSPRETMALYLRGEHERVCETFLQVLEHLGRSSFARIDAPTHHSLDAFVATLLYVLSQPDFAIAERFAPRFVEFNLTISNLVAISSFRTTDAHLEIVRPQKGNFVKVLTLYSARNAVKLDRAAMVGLQPAMFALWYAKYAAIYRAGIVDSDVCENLAEHFRFEHPLFKPLILPEVSYFASTYVDGECERVIKPRINAACREALGTTAAAPASRGVRQNKIAIVSAFWFPGHSVYRIFSAYVKTLKPKYHLTYFHIPGLPHEPDVSLFDEVRILSQERWGEEIDRVRSSGDFAAAYFPEVGMHADSVALANFRFAPVQLASHGHPVSTFGSEIDYWISGAEVERAGAELDYSERLVLLPGLGAIHRRPAYAVQGRRKGDDRVVVNCSWHPQKVSHQFCGTLREIIRRAAKPLRLRLFLGSTLTRENDFLPFARVVSETLGAENVELYPGLDYAPYMALMEEGDFGIDSFHFGGGNVVADNLHLGKPIVCREGDRWYNRIGPAMLRRAGLGELVATSEAEFVEKSLRLIDDDGYRGALTERLGNSDLDATVFSDADAPSFAVAIDHLIENHEAIRSGSDRSPIRVAR